MKKLIRLTEGDLHRIVKESVKMVLRESENDYLTRELARFITMNRNWSEEEENKAFDLINSWRCDIDTASPRIYNEMSNLADDFALDHDLPEEWRDNVDLNELFWELGE